MKQPHSGSDGSNVIELPRPNRPRLEFWYEFASTYSYLSAMRIETLAASHGVVIDWKPFLLGPIFKRQGWDTSPFNLYPAKGRYMWRDVERRCIQYGLPFALPDPFPQNCLLAARIAFAGRHQPWIGDFTRAVYVAEFGAGEDVADEALLAGLLLEAGAPAQEILKEAKSPQTKIGLRAAVAEAQERGLFGAPSFMLSNGELYWGDDRLDDALEEAVRITATAGQD